MERLNKKEADSCLNKLIDEALEGSNLYVERGTAVAMELRTLLIEESKKLDKSKEPKKSKALSISRAPDLAGSIGKQSHLGPRNHPDLDMVLYINVPPHLKDIYKTMDKIPDHELKKVIADTIKTISEVVETEANTNRDMKFNGSWEVCVDVKYKGYDFDLVPAINFQEGTKKAGNEQWTAVLNRCAKEGKDLAYLGPSMSDMVVEYVHGRKKCENVTEEENTFCRRVIVLAKMWKLHMKLISKLTDHGLKKVEKMCAESTIIELVAMFAAQSEYKYKDVVPSVTKAFAKFLEIMATNRKDFKVILDTRGVAFPCNVKEQLDANGAKAGEILIDPVNPYLNYLDASNYDVIDGMKELQWAAKKSLSILRYGCYCGCGKLERRMRHAVGIILLGEKFGGD